MLKKILLILPFAIYPILSATYFIVRGVDIGLIDLFVIDLIAGSMGFHICCLTWPFKKPNVKATVAKELATMKAEMETKFAEKFEYWKEDWKQRN